MLTFFDLQMQATATTNTMAITKTPTTAGGTNLTTIIMTLEVLALVSVGGRLWLEPAVCPVGVGVGDRGASAILVVA